MGCRMWMGMTSPITDGQGGIGLYFSGAFGMAFLLTGCDVPASACSSP